MKEVICITCPRGCRLYIDDENGYTVTGNACERGIGYGKNELINPVRTITSTVKLVGSRYTRCPVRTSAPIPKGDIFDIMKELDKVEVKVPVEIGDIVIENVLGTGVNIIAARRYLA